MPEQETVQRAKKKKQQGKAPSTQAGEFVREEIHHIREGKHGNRHRIVESKEGRCRSQNAEQGTNV